MMTLPCPWCGPRDQEEFRWRGQAHIVRPAQPELIGDEAWARYLFARDNTRGNAHELWHHIYGCGGWFAMERDTVSHAIKTVYSVRDDPPKVRL